MSFSRTFLVPFDDGKVLLRAAAPDSVGPRRETAPSLPPQTHVVPHSASPEDRTINPDLEQFMAKRMGADTIEVKASHLSLISQPEMITKLT